MDRIVSKNKRRNSVLDTRNRKSQGTEVRLSRCWEVIEKTSTVSTGTDEAGKVRKCWVMGKCWARGI